MHHKTPERDGGTSVEAPAKCGSALSPLLPLSAKASKVTNAPRLLIFL